jgi:hypothetical protein
LHPFRGRFVEIWWIQFKIMIPPVSMSASEIRRIDAWYNVLQASLVAPNFGDRYDEVPPPEGGSTKDDEPGNVALR